LVQNAPLTADLDFSLVWPDSEYLFENLISSEAMNQWQMPLGTLPISTFGTTGSSIGTIPSGESHQVSLMKDDLNVITFESLPHVA